MKLSIKEATAYAKVSRATLYRLMDGKPSRLSSHYIQGTKRRFIDSNDIDRLYIKVRSDAELLDAK